MLYRRLKPVLLYLTYFFIACGISTMATVTTDNIFDTIGFKLMTAGCFAFWITFFAMKFDWFEDAEFMPRKAALWVGLISSGLLIALQIYIRMTLPFFRLSSLSINTPPTL